MRRSSFLIFSCFLILPFSAQAQLDKHDESIANHGYSFPITVYETPVLTAPGTTLRDDIENGINPPAMPVTPAQAVPVTPSYDETGTTPTLPPAMPAKKSDLEEDLDQLMEKKTLN